MTRMKHPTGGVLEGESWVFFPHSLLSTSKPAHMYNTFTNVAHFATKEQRKKIAAAGVATWRMCRGSASDCKTCLGNTRGTHWARASSGCFSMSVCFGVVLASSKTVIPNVRAIHMFGP